MSESPDWRDDQNDIHKKHTPLLTVITPIGNKPKPPRPSHECACCYVEFITRKSKLYCIDCTGDRGQRQFRKKMVIKFGRDYWKNHP